MLTVGLTGDVGAGKSTVSRVWREMGAFVVDADSTAKELWFDPEVQNAAKVRWGEGFFDCGRKELFKKIAAKIFNDAGEYQFASKMLHGRTSEEIKRLLSLAEGKRKWAVVEVPLLYESGAYNWFDCVVYVTAPIEKRKAQNSERNWDDEEITRRERHLLPRDTKIKRSDFVIENIGTLGDLEKKARELARRFV
jgi:dephospho-CoA kinase